MKSKFLTAGAVAAAALALGAFASPAAAAKINYTFGTPSGGAYCDGIKMTATSGAYAGFHINSNCDSVNDPAGGLSVKIGSSKYVEGMTGVMDALPNTPIMFYLDIKAKTWYLYLNTYNLDGTSAYQELNAGTLIKGAPAAHKGGTPSVHVKAGAKIDKMPVL
jgi:hypothetical protein